MHEHSILLSTAGAVYPAGYARSYHHPKKGVWDARAKDAGEVFPACTSAVSCFVMPRGKSFRHARMQATQDRVSGGT